MIPYSHSEIIRCPTCRQEKEFYLDTDGYCIYETKCICDKTRAKNKLKTLDIAMKQLDQMIANGEFNYGK